VEELQQCVDNNPLIVWFFSEEEIGISIALSRSKGSDMIRYQRTIEDSITFEGIGLHSGRHARVRLSPAPVNTGIQFLRIDLGGVPVRAVAGNTGDTGYATTLCENGASVRTVEHLLAALSGLGVSNAFIEIDAEEVPIMDGSAGPFIRLLAAAGIRTQDRIQPVLKVTRPTFVCDDDKQMTIWPAETLSISCSIDFDHAMMHEQTVDLQLSERIFIRDVADARTFGFLKDLQALQTKGLALGASLKNAVALSEDAVVNQEGLRYQDEFVRHKVLDIVGDLALVGMPVIGRIVAHKSGHGLHARMIAKLLRSPFSCVVVGDSDRIVPSCEALLRPEPAVL
jgi:UDP-3-O-[3-hydroxymyristoyl] N-acetylglucosamine deacetylase